jgi:release factor glutamine methyltransferase
MSSAPPTVETAVTVARLRAAGCVFAEDEARLLHSAAASPVELERFVQRRTAGEPLEVIVGFAEFCGLRIAVRAGVFVPRQRTECLVDQAVPLARAGSVLLDLCCGTGAVAAAVAARVPGLRVHAGDIDPAAVRCARQNLTPGGGAVYLSDLYAGLPQALLGRVDLLTVNAPYVPSGRVRLMPPEAREHEPLHALDGGPDGLDLQRRVIAGAARWLAPGGRLLVETSDDQAGLTAAAVTTAGLSVRVNHCDEHETSVVIASGG